jgi:hypothetical protein
MSWAALANNECVSCNNLQDAVNTSVFVLKNSIPVSTKQITKAEAENYVYINPISKANNQLVVKSNLISNPPITTTTTTTTTPIPVYYNILDCGNSSTAYSIAYAAGTFATSERCTAVASGFPTRTVIIIGSTTTLPGGPLYTLTSQGVFGC